MTRRIFLCESHRLWSEQMHPKCCGIEPDWEVPCIHPDQRCFVVVGEFTRDAIDVALEAVTREVDRIADTYPSADFMGSSKRRAAKASEYSHRQSDHTEGET